MALIRCAVLVGPLWLALATTLPVPRTVRSVDGSLDITLTLERVSITLSNGVTLNTRAYNKTVPGPTLRMKAGDTLRVHFQNLLPDQGSSYVHNQFSAADESNVHFHGLHVSGELPSDDSTVPVLPGVLLIEHESFIDFVLVLLVHQESKDLWGPIELHLKVSQWSYRKLHLQKGLEDVWDILEVIQL